VNAFQVKDTPQHDIADRAIKYAEGYCGPGKSHHACLIALSQVALWTVNVNDPQLKSDKNIGFVARIASKLIIKHFEGDDQ
jgi:hypothetical protein